MSFYDNLLNQIVVCPRCNGYGFLPPPPDIKKIENCPECNIAGVFLNKQDRIFLFSLPTYLDSKSRRRISLIKKSLVASLIILILIIIISLNTKF
jgi:hypothetical protein